jgi:hypothetical protein
MIVALNGANWMLTTQLERYDQQPCLLLFLLMLPLPSLVYDLHIANQHHILVLRAWNTNIIGLNHGHFVCSMLVLYYVELVPGLRPTSKCKVLN